MEVLVHTRVVRRAMIMFVFLSLTSKGRTASHASLVFAVFALLLYVPAGYYLEMFL